MENSQENISKENPGKAKKLKRLFSYAWVLNNMSYFFFLTVLAVVYIANGHTADKVIREINKTEKQLKELQYEYKTLKSEVMYKSEESQLVKSVEPLGLKITPDVPVRIKKIEYKEQQ